MVTRFLMADTHFGHENINKFMGKDGQKLRPFSCAEEMDETIVNNVNRVCGPKDILYIAGDVVIGRRHLETLKRIHCEKVLIKGNHDIFDLKYYAEVFRDIRGSHKLGEFIITHIPIHPQSLARWCTGNIHGHLHDGRVLLEDGSIDRRYICVSCEHINYTPIAFDDIESIR